MSSFIRNAPYLFALALCGCSPRTPDHYGVFVKTDTDYATAKALNIETTEALPTTVCLIVFDKNINTYIAQGIHLYRLEEFPRRNWSQQSLGAWPGFLAQSQASASASATALSSIPLNSSDIPIFVSPAPRIPELIEITPQSPLSPGLYQLASLVRFTVDHDVFLNSLPQQARASYSASNFRDAFDYASAAEALYVKYRPAEQIRIEMEGIKLHCLEEMGKNALNSKDYSAALSYAAEIGTQYDKGLGGILGAGILLHQLSDQIVANDWALAADTATKLMDSDQSAVAEAQARAKADGIRLFGLDDFFSQLLANRLTIDESLQVKIVNALAGKKDPRLIPAVISILKQLAAGPFPDVSGFRSNGIGYNADPISVYVWYLGQLQEKVAVPLIKKAYSNFGAAEAARNTYYDGINKNYLSALEAFDGNIGWRKCAGIYGGIGGELLAIMDHIAASDGGETDIIDADTPFRENCLTLPPFLHKYWYNRFEGRKHGFGFSSKNRVPGSWEIVSPNSVRMHLTLVDMDENSVGGVDLDLRRDLEGRGPTRTNWRIYNVSIAEPAPGTPDLVPRTEVGFLLRASRYDREGDLEKALADYLHVIQLDPQSADCYNDAAWIMAVSPDPKLRDGAKAVEFAKKAIELINAIQGYHEFRAKYLDTLAAAYAEVGKFNDAVETEAEFLQKADPINAREGRRRLKLYEQNQPYRLGQ